MAKYYRLTLLEKEMQAVKDALLFLENECIITEEVRQVRFLSDLRKIIDYIEPEGQ